MANTGEIITTVLAVIGALTLIASGARRFFVSARSSIKEFKRLVDEIKPKNKKARERKPVSEKEAQIEPVQTQREPKSILWDRLSFIGSIALLLFSLAWDLSATGPVTRVEIFLISVKVVLWGMVVIMEIIWRLVAIFKDIARDFVEILKDFLEVNKGFIKHDEGVNNILSDMAKLLDKHAQVLEEKQNPQSQN